eukprot:GHVT01060860.1.p1 GENE.GHVT01060860.1~~GHVT01060860.1.p1  ORF type:complete len:328 (-),score=62.84 GHVT01060860.1:152-1135(-)
MVVPAGSATARASTVAQPSKENEAHPTAEDRLNVGDSAGNKEALMKTGPEMGANRTSGEGPSGSLPRMFPDPAAARAAGTAEIGAAAGDDEEDDADDGGDMEDGLSTRIEQLMEGRVYNILMLIFTVVALFGDDMRVLFVNKAYDDVVYAALTGCFLFFLGEITIFCIIRPNYKWSLDFSLDAVATGSLLLDIGWITQGNSTNIFDVNIMELSSFDASNQGDVQSAFAGLEAGRMVRLVRLIRLFRVIKLYRIILETQRSDQEEKLKEQERAALNAKQAALTRVEASQLGKQLSEIITQIVIIGALVMLLCSPILQRPDSEDRSQYV